MKRLVIGLMLVCLLISSASAWVIDDREGRVQGTVDFYIDGTGVLNVTGGPVINFNWYQSGDMIKANYLFYSVDVYYNSDKDELYSPSVGNVTLKR
jgi:hypothetical protein